MTKKDYKLIAEGFKESLDDCVDDKSRLAVKITAFRVANKLKQDNPRFVDGKFLAACGLEV